jgi:hypothetical protein
MSQTTKFVRRNRVDERRAAAIAVVAGVCATFAGARPTGAALVDVPLVAAAVAAVVWASASAPWWTPTLAAGIGATIALDPFVALVGAVAFGVGLIVGIRRRDQSELRALVGAMAMNVLIRSDLDGFHGLSALIGCALGVLVFVLGVRRRPSATMRVASIASASIVVVAVIAVLGLAVIATSARADLSSGAQQARQAISVLNAGDYEEAARLFESSSGAFARTDSGLGGALALPSRLVPGVAQNVRAGADLAAAAATGTAEAAAALRAIDPESLTVIDGRIDLDAVAAVESPLLRVQGVLDDLQAASADVASPWLLAPVQDELADLDERLASNEPRLENAIDAVRLAPKILGADGPRRYLVLFTTPVEARGLAGFVGNYAVITADDGAIGVTDFGRRSDLEQYVIENGAACDGCPQEFLDRYGRFGIIGGDEFGGFGDRGWTSVTLPAHFPYVGEAVQVLFPQSGGPSIDGVIAMDPYVIQALMGYTGPIEVPELGLTVDPEDSAEFVLRDQYAALGVEDLSGNDDRVDALETIGTEVIRRLLQGSLPVPSEIARDLGPLVSEQRLLFWIDDPVEQSLFDRIGMLGALPELGDDGGFGLMVSNAGHSKIDLYLDRTVDVTVETADDGSRTLVADVTLTNTAPATGLPRYVIGNDYGFPSGTSILWINFFGPPELLSATRNAEEIELSRSTEAGWTAYEHDELLGPGETVMFRLEFALRPAAASDEAEPVLWSQPLADRDP